MGQKDNVFPSQDIQVSNFTKNAATGSPFHPLMDQAERDAQHIFVDCFSYTEEEAEKSLSIGSNIDSS